jgi:predicted oxidoreductase
MAWNPLGSVFKTDDEKSNRVRVLAESLALKYQVAIDVLLLAWILRHPAGIIPVCGTTDKIRISQLMQATSVTLELEDWFALWVESAGAKVP